MPTLDDLPILATTKTKKPTQAEVDRQRGIDYLRMSAEWHLRLYIKQFSLLDVQRIWFEEQAKLKAERGPGGAPHP